MTIILTIASLFAAAIPMLFFLFVVWNLDLYDRKPLWLVGASFLWGALGAVLIAIFFQIIIDFPVGAIFSPELAMQISVTFVAPLTEEPAKAFILLLLIRSRKYGNICDGFIFGAAAGLGFGMTENAKYFIEGAMMSGDSIVGAAAWSQLVVTRTLFSALMHATASSLVGAAMGFGKFYPRIIRAICASVGMALAMAIHALWNGILVTDVSSGEDFLRLAQRFGVEGPMEPFYLDAILFGIELLLTLSLFFLFQIWESRKLHKNLKIEAENGIIPSEHVPFLASILKRREHGWLDAKIPQKEYISLSTQLALRGGQSRMLTDKRKEWYDSDYRRLQQEVRDILSLDT
ncbi:MAG: PrsW family intramembrane metalloprotease [Myxococcota bacterium]|nr:PrsW family intramembrane metalloprotease [Myxococcota bacterium]